MTFRYQDIDLPIQSLVPEVQQALAQHNTLIVKAPPGAGKSTLLPLALMDAPWLAGRKIVMLEPRRLAARGIATRMSQLLARPVGQEVGYRIRFDTKVSTRTRIEVLTEGILTRMLQSDNALEEVGLVIFDEFHERSLFADLALALCREAQQLLRPDLRLLIMSATLDIPLLASGLQAPVLESEGTQYPIDIRYLGEGDPRLLPELCARAAEQAVAQHVGDVLVFLPGQAEILKCQTLLKQRLPELAIRPLYGQLSQQEQLLALLPDKQGRRKVVLATSIAETSLTIEGVRCVVDSGYGRYSRFDPTSSLTRLETDRISRDEAQQRAGRAGRLGPGLCLRLWAAQSHGQLAEHRVAEIDQADLCSLILDLANWGQTNPAGLFWLTSPPAASVQQAQETLHELEALEDDKITALGRKMLRLACHPRLAHMLLKAQELGLLPLACDLAAIIDERDFLPRDAGANINLRIEALRRFRQRGQGLPALGFIEQGAAAFRQMFGIEPHNGAVDEYATGLLLAQAYPERIAAARPGNNAPFQLANGKIASLGHADTLAHEPWLAVAHVDARSGNGKIFLASPLNPKDLAPLLKEKKQLKWDAEEAALVARKNLCIGSIVLRSVPWENPEPEALVQAMCQVIRREGLSLLTFDDDFEQLQHRLLSLGHWQPDAEWPDARTATLLQQPEVWLAPYLANVRKEQQLRKLPLAEILLNSLPYPQQQELALLCPTHVEVPSGSRIRLQYKANGEVPLLSVRLQEVFGLLETPRVLKGQKAVLLELLSPGYKPVQLTADLHSFWSSAYFEVKKELRRRYPKHSWPDDPFTATAVRGAVRRRSE